MKRQLLPWIVFVMLLGGSMTAWTEDKVKVTGDNIRGDTEKKISYISGNVRIVQGTDIINTDYARVDLDKKLLFLEGNVIFTNDDNLMVTANILDYNMKKKMGTFRENVLLQRFEAKTPKKGSNNKDPFTLFTDELYFEANTKNFTAKQGRIVHKDFTGTADVIEYNDKLQLLTLQGNSYLKRPEGEELRGDVTRINLEKKTFVVENNVVIHFDVDKEDDDSQKDKGDPPKPAEQSEEPPAETDEGPAVEITEQDPLPETDGEAQPEQTASA